MPSLGRERDVDRAVSLRTADDYAIVQDLPRGREQVGIHGFPFPANFDALSNFEYTWHVSMHGDLEVDLVRQNAPLFTPPTPGAQHVDVIVLRVANYKASYVGAPDANPIHIHLEPLPGLIKKRTDIAFHDVYVDPTTYLPTEVRFEGPDHQVLVVDYASVGPYWLVSHVAVDQTVYGPLRIGSAHVHAEAAFEGYQTSDTPPDPRLAPKP